MTALQYFFMSLFIHVYIERVNTKILNEISKALLRTCNKTINVCIFSRCIVFLLTDSMLCGVFFHVFFFWSFCVCVLNAPHHQQQKKHKVQSELVSRVAILEADHEHEENAAAPKKKIPPDVVYNTRRRESLGEEPTPSHQHPTD